MEAVKNIGKLKLKEMERNGEGLLEGFSEDVSGGGVYKNCLEIQFEKNKDIYIYSGVNLKQYDSEDKAKYLYRGGSPRGADVTPTAKITDINKTLPNKILKAVSDALDFGNNKYQEEKKLLEGIHEVLSENLEQIKEDIKSKLADIPKKEGSFLTLSLKADGEKKYIGDFELFREKVVSDALNKFHYSETYKKDVYKKDATCSLCMETCNEVYGKVDVFPFYTIDKPGYISGGFKSEK